MKLWATAPFTCGLLLCSSVVLAQSITTGVPLSYVEETELVQTLSDGTHIVNQTHRNFYRDSQGRTRVETFSPKWLDPSQQPQIEISNPVEHVNCSRYPPATGRCQFYPPPPPPRPISLPTPKMQMMRKGLTSPLKPPPPQPREGTPQTQLEDLGTQMIEGVMTRGTRTTTTIPVDAEGNDRPLVSVSEYWYSDELHLRVLQRNSGPRTGEATTRLVSIDRNEPDPRLFQPPADYIVDGR